MADLFANEYGWTMNYIKNELSLEEETKLIHAILCRKNVKVIKKYSDVEYIQKSLTEYVDELHKTKIDNNPILEGIIF